LAHAVPDPKPAVAVSTAAVIAPRGLRRLRTIAFRAYVLAAASLFVILAILAHSVAYFPVDLRVTRAVQDFHGPGFDAFMRAISWTGFFPQVAALSAAIITLLFAAGLRWESVSCAFATLSGALAAGVKLIVLRPRPSADLVHVFAQLRSPGFPSGHVLTTTAFCGFVAFLVYTLLKPSRGRTSALVALLLFIALMGPSRIDMGQHWFSDVMGAYLIGSLWLVLTIEFYRWGKPRFFLHPSVAPATSSVPSSGTP
jgi:undecaprenyl-diphosphatase